MKHFRLLLGVVLLSVIIGGIGIVTNKSKLISPNPQLNAHQVLTIQLQSLQHNKKLGNNFGIKQTYEFAHPNNKALTGPIHNFIEMLETESYSILLNHSQTSITTIHQDPIHEVFEVTVTKGDKKATFIWTILALQNEQQDIYWYTASVMPFNVPTI